MGENVRVGDTLAGRYLVEKILGQGGMGVVVGARHIHLDERVAIKMLLPELATHGEVVERFMREARASSKIKSEHVCRVSDVALLDSGEPYMVMEHLDGSDLAAICRARGPLGVGEAVRHVLQACDAIAEAHSLGIVHRDLKPANLFLVHRRDGSPSVKVLDFGISKDRGSESDHGLTKTTAALGSPNYMSPEQMLSTRDVDGRTDIWALGVTLYQLVTGSTPFVGATLPQICALVLQTEPRPPRDLRPDLPPGLEAIILRCLRKDRAERFASVAELATALTPFAGDGSAPQPVQVARLAVALDAAQGSSSAATLELQSSTLVLPAGASPRYAPSPVTPGPMAVAPGGTSAIPAPDGSSSGGVWAQSHAALDPGRSLPPVPATRRKSRGGLIALVATLLAGSAVLVVVGRGMLTSPDAAAVAPRSDLEITAATPSLAAASLPEVTPVDDAPLAASAGSDASARVPGAASAPPAASASAPPITTAPSGSAKAALPTPRAPTKPPPVKKTGNPFED